MRNSALCLAALACAAAVIMAGPAAAAEQASGGVDFFQSELGDILDTPMLAAA
jgi:hypothetical protein